MSKSNSKTNSKANSNLKNITKIKISQDDFEEKVKNHSNKNNYKNLEFKNYEFDNFCPRYYTVFKNITFKDCLIRYSNFSESLLFNIDFKNCDIEFSGFENNKMKNVHFNKSVFKDCSFRSTFLDYSSFYDCDLSNNNNFENVKILGASFKNSNLENVKFPSPFELFNISWGELSDELTKQALALDCNYYFGDIKNFDEWAKRQHSWESFCPYQDNKFGRIIQFAEKGKLWNSELVNTKINLYEFLRKLFKEKGNKINF